MADAEPRPTIANAPEAVTGVHLMQGIGHRPARGFWAEAWSRVFKRPAAVLSLVWIGLVALVAVVAPLIANGHPIVVAASGENPIQTLVSATVAAAFDPGLGLPALFATIVGALLWVFTPSSASKAVRLGGGLALAALYGVAGWLLLRANGPGEAAAVLPWLLAAAGVIGLAWIPAALDMSASMRVMTAWVPVALGLGVLLTLAPGAGGVNEEGVRKAAFESPMVKFLSGMDIVLLMGLIVGIAAVAPRSEISRATRAWAVILGMVAASCVVLVGRAVSTLFSSRDAADWMREAEQQSWLPLAVAAAAAVVFGLLFCLAMPAERARVRMALAFLAVGVGCAISVARWTEPLERFTYARDEAGGRISALYTVVPWSPAQGSTTRDFLQPGRSVYASAIDPIADAFADLQGGKVFADDPRFGAVPGPNPPTLAGIPLDEPAREIIDSQIRLAGSDLPENTDAVIGDLDFAVNSGEVTSVGGVIDWLSARSAPGFAMGTDSLGQDVFSQMLHACRLSISIGLVSSSIAVVIGVTMGALMGYFGGWIDMLLYRIVEIFMAVPVLFLLIVAAGVLPRNTYVMMAIIGCFSWTGAARFTRAEFFKLRSQDFVQAARSAGLPLHRVLFRHILPNGVTPVLVDTSFLIAVAITIEVILSYLGLGPANQASWGRLLSDATTSVGQFVWWLAMIPGLAIFLTVLSYNLIGEALRDAIDPKLAKARV